MDPRCARCNKIVYPVEKLACLDKFWHKACFKCHECGMTLNMKSYKGYDKQPYCGAHYPQSKFTVVADTVESRRFFQNTKQQSQIEYQKEFNKEKGQYTSIHDDPETVRNLRVNKNVSNVSYHAADTGQYGGRDPRMAVAGRVPPPMSRSSAPAFKPPVTRYVAMYDYTATDVDEVSIADGDIITDAHRIDEGWMEGRVQRTGKYGLFPANYVVAS